MKTGLVLEGGGLRGIYTVGVLDVLMEEELFPDYAVGVSAGAANAVSYLSGQKGRGYRVNTQYLGDKRYMSLSNLIRKHSLFGMDLIFDEIPNALDTLDYEAIQRSPIEFYTGVTSCEDGQALYSHHFSPSGNRRYPLRGRRRGGPDSCAEGAGRWMRTDRCRADAAARLSTEPDAYASRLSSATAALSPAGADAGPPPYRL